MKNKERFIIDGVGIVINPKLTEQEKKRSEEIDKILKKTKNKK